MPRKDKKSKKGKAKKSLSTADILKLLKKLKPQTQQIVRVNVGDSDKKKKKGDVQSSYNPPFVFPTRENPAITSLGQPPFKPPLIEEPRQAASWRTQPIKEDVPLLPPPPQPSTLYITEGESGEEIIIPRRKGKAKKEAPTPEYKVRQPYGSAEPRFNPGITFNEPKLVQPSNLSAASAAPTRFYQPVQNDKFQADIIQTNPSGDQIGTLADKISSALWTGTPEGEITLTPEQTQAAIEEDQQPISLSEVFIEEPTFEEEQQQQIQEEEAAAAPTEVVSSPSPVKSNRPLASLKMIDEINSAIKSSNFSVTNIPSQYVGTRGTTKGLIKNSTPGYVLSPIYEEMLKFTGKK